MKPKTPQRTLAFLLALGLRPTAATWRPSGRPPAALTLGVIASLFLASLGAQLPCAGDEEKDLACTALPARPAWGLRQSLEGHAQTGLEERLSGGLEEGVPVSSGRGLTIQELRDLLDQYVPWGVDYYDGSRERENYLGGVSAIPNRKPWEGFGHLHGQFIQKTERTRFDVTVVRDDPDIPGRTYAIIVGYSAGLEEERTVASRWPLAAGTPATSNEQPTTALAAAGLEQKTPSQAALTVWSSFIQIRKGQTLPIHLPDGKSILLAFSNRGKVTVQEPIGLASFRGRSLRSGGGWEHRLWATQQRIIPSHRGGKPRQPRDVDPQADGVYFLPVPVLEGFFDRTIHPTPPPPEVWRQQASYVLRYLQKLPDGVIHLQLDSQQPIPALSSQRLLLSPSLSPSGPEAVPASATLAGGLEEGWEGPVAEPEHASVPVPTEGETLGAYLGRLTGWAVARRPSPDAFRFLFQPPLPESGDPEVVIAPANLDAEGDMAEVHLLLAKSIQDRVEPDLDAPARDWIWNVERTQKEARWDILIRRKVSPSPTAGLEEERTVASRWPLAAGTPATSNEQPTTALAAAGLEESERQFVRRMRKEAHARYGSILVELAGGLQRANRSAAWAGWRLTVERAAQGLERRGIGLQAFAEQTGSRWAQDSRWLLYERTFRFNVRALLQRVHRIAVSLELYQQHGKLDPTTSSTLVQTSLTLLQHPTVLVLQSSQAEGIPPVASPLTAEEWDRLLRLQDEEWGFFGPLGRIDLPAVIQFDSGAFVPSPAQATAELMKEAGVNGTSVVYDAGSGVGSALAVAGAVFNARGFGREIAPELTEVGQWWIARLEQRGLLRPGQVRVEKGDAFSISPQGFTHLYSFPPGTDTYFSAFDQWIAQMPAGVKIVILPERSLPTTPIEQILPSVASSGVWNTVKNDSKGIILERPAAGLEEPRDVIAKMLEEVRAVQDDPRVGAKAGNFERIFLRLPQLGERLVAAYRSLAEGRGLRPGKIRLFVVGGRVPKLDGDTIHIKPLRPDSDIDLLFAVENPNEGFGPASGLLNDTIIGTPSRLKKAFGRLGNQVLKDLGLPAKLHFGQYYKRLHAESPDRDLVVLEVVNAGALLERYSDEVENARSGRLLIASYDPPEPPAAGLEESERLDRDAFLQRFPDQARQAAAHPQANRFLVAPSGATLFLYRPETLATGLEDLVEAQKEALPAELDLRQEPIPSSPDEARHLSVFLWDKALGQMAYAPDAPVVTMWNGDPIPYALPQLIAIGLSGSLDAGTVQLVTAWRFERSGRSYLVFAVEA